MNLIADIGNTLVKLAVFEGDSLVELVTKNDLKKEDIDRLFSECPIEKSIYSTVRDSSEDENLLKNYKFIQLTHQTAIPLAIKYKTPETLGLDRIAAVMGAKSSFANDNLLVIDMGTCITADFLNAQNEYLGGSISPGLTMRFHALNHFTGKLPLIKYDGEKINPTGDSTETSILSGVYYGVKHEVEGIISRYLTQYDSLKVVVTGGNINLFDLEPKNRIFADEFLVLKGLNEILKYNEE